MDLAAVFQQLIIDGGEHTCAGVHAGVIRGKNQNLTELSAVQGFCQCLADLLAGKSCFMEDCKWLIISLALLSGKEVSKTSK